MLVPWRVLLWITLWSFDIAVDVPGFFFQTDMLGLLEGSSDDDVSISHSVYFFHPLPFMVGSYKLS